MFIFADLLEQCGKELERPRRPGRPGAECLMDLYLFAHAVGSAADDFLAGKRPTDKPAAQRRFISSAGEWFQRALGRRSLTEWQQRWEECLAGLARIIARRAPARESEFAALRRAMHNLLDRRLPGSLRGWPVMLPDQFTSPQSLPCDAPCVVEAFLVSGAAPNLPLLIIELRAAGAWLAPLIKAGLEERGWPAVDWVAMDPGRKLSRREGERLRQAQCPEVRLLVVDNGRGPEPHLPLLLAWLRKFGAEPDRTTVLVLAAGAQGGRHTPLPEHDRYRVVCFDPSAGRLAEPAAATLPDFPPDLLAA